MKTITENTPGVPASGSVLKFLIRAVDLPTKSLDGINDQTLHRLSAGGLSKENLREVALKLIDRLLQADQVRPAEADLLKSADERYVVGAPYAERWKEDEQGNVIYDRVELANQLARFLILNGALRQSLAPDFTGPAARKIWIFLFVIPFLAGKLAELKSIGVDWEAGMPGGRLWYIPAEIGAPGGKPVFRQWPCNQVLKWWADLLGRGLENYPVQLCGADSEEARRQIRQWLKTARPPSFDAILRWTDAKQRWEYQGAFRDRPDLPLRERWILCRDFLARKGMRGGENWMAQLPADASGDRLRAAYRGEGLELEIPPFRAVDVAFERFFASPDPIAEGLPVEELIERVACRWRQPSLTEVRIRLLVAVAAQNAVRDLSEGFSMELAGNACRWFTGAYNRLFDAQQGADPHADPELAKQQAIAILRQQRPRNEGELIPLVAAFSSDASQLINFMQSELKRAREAGL